MSVAFGNKKVGGMDNRAKYRHVGFTGNSSDSKMRAFDPLFLYQAVAAKYKALPPSSRMDDGWKIPEWRFLSGMNLVINTAKKYQNRGAALLVLIEEGNLGLLEACENFSETQGCSFSVYASWWIRQAIIKGTACPGLPVNFVAVTAAVAKEVARQTTQNGTSGDLTESIYSFVLHQLLNRIFCQLSDSKKELLLKLGINGPCPFTLHETQEVLDVARACVRHILDEKGLKSCPWCEYDSSKLYA